MCLDRKVIQEIFLRISLNLFYRRVIDQGQHTVAKNTQLFITCRLLNGNRRSIFRISTGATEQ